MKTKIYSNFFILLVLTFCSLNSTISAQTEGLEDLNAVKSAIEDYVYGLYEVDPDRLASSVDTSLRKIGYWYDEKNSVYRDDLEMSYEKLYNLAARWNKEGNRVDENSPKDIVIYEVKDKTAIAKLTAIWGIDYFQLAKVEGKWKIKNIIWQSHTPE